MANTAMWMWSEPTWPPNKTAPTKADLRRWQAQDEMWAQWQEAMAENMKRDWVARCVITGLCTVCGTGPASICRANGTCGPAMDAWRRGGVT